jgi:hypothetical protein
MSAMVLQWTDALSLRAYRRLPTHKLLDNRYATRQIFSVPKEGFYQSSVGLYCPVRDLLFSLIFSKVFLLPSPYKHGA